MIDLATRLPSGESEALEFKGRWNDAAVETYGYSRDEFLAIAIADIRPPEDVCLCVGLPRDV